MEFVPRLRTKYYEEIVPAMMEQFKYKSIMEVPRLVKINLNQGFNSATSDKKSIEGSLKEMTAIAGQKAVPTRARLSVSNFKLREGMTVGSRVTLRKDRMHEFLDRFVAITLPRVRDFRGISDKSFDGRGNYSMGITEHIIFPEIDLDKINKITGMDITFVTTAKTDAEALALLKFYGMPFKNQNNNN